VHLTSPQCVCGKKLGTVCVVNINRSKSFEKNPQVSGQVCCEINKESRGRVDNKATP
jgi:hypothetical protein